ncbi:undecaprenyldiphospho-muramoylpentapeptide beta-N-acetylglucosaminyltransferase [Pusillimonas sp. TS35]|nr:undecaprenyldiphospho-muramoylpentapeptide beta-N-acetylglucosaminyltransferase [Pusillimonas sp. TS35]
MSARTLLIMAGGTGGHIMPGLAVAHEMKQRGWRVLWLGHPERMEGQLVPPQGFELVPLRFAGLRGKGPMALFKLPFTLLRACAQARRALARVKPDVVLGMGGYVAFPGGVMAAMRRIPLVVHEQNAIAGTANRWLARMAQKVLVGFPGALPGAIMVGNPVRTEFSKMPAPFERYALRKGPLRVLIVGGSLGAAPLNAVMPQAIALLAPQDRPVVLHQAGERHIDTLRAAYAQAGVEADCRAFIEDMANEMANADVVICRAGAMTVAEIAAVGVAALFVPLPHAIDDHQTANARYLSDCNGALMRPQSELNAQWLADWLSALSRSDLARMAAHAHEHAWLQARSQIADACEQVAGSKA